MQEQKPTCRGSSEVLGILPWFERIVGERGRIFNPILQESASSADIVVTKADDIIGSVGREAVLSAARLLTIGAEAIRITALTALVHQLPWREHRDASSHAGACDLPSQSP